MAKVTYGRAQAPAGPARFVESWILWGMFTNEEWASLSGSTQANAVALINTLRIQNVVNKGRIGGILTALEAIGLIGNGRADEIYNGLP